MLPTIPAQKSKPMYYNLNIGDDVTIFPHGNSKLPYRIAKVVLSHDMMIETDTGHKFRRMPQEDGFMLNEEGVITPHRIPEPWHYLYLQQKQYGIYIKNKLEVFTQELNDSQQRCYGEDYVATLKNINRQIDFFIKSLRKAG